MVPELGDSSPGKPRAQLAELFLETIAQREEGEDGDPSPSWKRLFLG